MLDSAIVFRIRLREFAATLEHDPEKWKPVSRLCKAGGG
jgi:hypothetical protein